MKSPTQIINRELKAKKKCQGNPTKKYFKELIDYYINIKTLNEFCFAFLKIKITAKIAIFYFF
ncbi:MAG: hypothetical protein A3F10_00665 [Coxiella sp. RIFCSPHIGHO2_12_FULL_42_15]|nr:MAG: hypothetical protein A3F10_00665 [Coxiella sp. RIFCSPHIGHO2_12_FULL_42_15]